MSVRTETARPRARPTVFAAHGTNDAVLRQPRVLIMDGGMGTTLQAPPFELELGSALWSSELLTTSEGQQKLVDLHSTWVRHGAQLLGTCTYQSSLPMFLPPQEAYTQADIDKAQQTMLSALSLACSDAIPSISATNDGDGSSEHKIQGPALALSLGPFGAQCQPGQEYAGLYPAPYGSKSTPSKFGFSKQAGQVIEPLPLDQVRSIKFTLTDDDDISSKSEQDHLAAWHLSRLRHFATSKHWSSVGVIAFETIPILTELKAVRRAMTAFNAEQRTRGEQVKPFYVSFVFPLDERGQAKFPDSDMRSLELDQQLLEMVKWCFATTEASQNDQEQDLPGGVGINCSNPDHIGKISEALSRAIDQTLPLDTTLKPWLVMYPDGGAVYDVFTKTWSNPSGMDELTWASKLATTISDTLSYRRSAHEGEDDARGDLLFGGVVAGGCCKAGPRYIQALRKVCEERGLL
ncbi:hypothetical protein ACM66B_001338 [Microbotryomycetes sp. NB124-2]